MDTLDTLAIDTTTNADLQAVLDRAFFGKPLDPEVGRRVQERAEYIRQEILQNHGVVNVAVDLIREGRHKE